MLEASFNTRSHRFLLVNITRIVIHISSLTPFSSFRWGRPAWPIYGPAPAASRICDPSRSRRPCRGVSGRGTENAPRASRTADPGHHGLGRDPDLCHRGNGCCRCPSATCSDRGRPHGPGGSSPGLSVPCRHGFHRPRRP